MAVYRKILFLIINKQRKSAWTEISGLRKNHLCSHFVTSGCPEMPKMFPQMCPGLWYLRNLITSPDYVKSRQTLTCLILVTRDSQPICTFLPQSRPGVMLSLHLYIDGQGVICCHPSVIRGLMIHQWHQIDWDQTEANWEPFGNGCDRGWAYHNSWPIMGNLYQRQIRSHPVNRVYKHGNMEMWKAFIFTLLIHKVLKELWTNKVVIEASNAQWPGSRSPGVSGAW